MKISALCVLPLFIVCDHYTISPPKQLHRETNILHRIGIITNTFINCFTKGSKPSLTPS